MLQETYSQIEITDLNNAEISSGVILEMQDRQRYFEARMAIVAEDEAATQVWTNSCFISYVISSIVASR